MKRVLVVDDDTMNLILAEDALTGSYEVFTANSGKEALLWLEENTADMIIMDIEMEDINGIDTVKLIKEDARWSHIPVIFLTANTDPKTEISCLKTGADDFITKPFVPMVMKTRVDRIMELYKLRYGLEKELEEKSRQLEMMTMHSIMSIANTIDAKDKYTSGHSTRVAKCSVAIAERLGWSKEELQNLQYVALLHDIGKIGVPDAVLNKPSRLTSDEFDIIKKHPSIGKEILKEIHTIPHVQEGALFHHERFDGNGYPYGLKGTNIPLYARIVCIADAYDAMSTDRVYRKHVSTEKMISEYERCRGSQFDPELTDIFIEMLKEGYAVDDTPLQEEFAETRDLLLDSVLKGYRNEAVNLSMMDFLTGLYNKAYAQIHVEDLLHSGHTGALFMMDLDDFKHINDAYGHIIGDKVLKVFADIMKNAASDNDVLCRVGGDEFIMFNIDMNSREAAAERAEKIINPPEELIAEVPMFKDFLSSIGIAFAQKGDDFLSLFKKADKALYFAKRNGKKTYHFFENSDYESEASSYNVDISNIRSIVEGRMDFSKGAFNLAYGEFQKVYNFIVRYMERRTQDTQILLLTVKNQKKEFSDIPHREQAMSELEQAISTSLRNSDVYTRYSSSQYIVILMDISEENGKMVSQRITSSFKKLHPSDAYVVHSEICRIN